MDEEFEGNDTVPEWLQDARIATGHHRPQKGKRDPQKIDRAVQEKPDGDHNPAWQRFADLVSQDLPGDQYGIGRDQHGVHAEADIDAAADLRNPGGQHGPEHRSGKGGGDMQPAPVEQPQTDPDKGQPCQSQTVAKRDGEKIVVARPLGQQGETDCRRKERQRPHQKLKAMPCTEPVQDEKHAEDQKCCKATQHYGRKVNGGHGTNTRSVLPKTPTSAASPTVRSERLIPA